VTKMTNRTAIPISQSFDDPLLEFFQKLLPGLRQRINAMVLDGL